VPPVVHGSGSLHEIPSFGGLLHTPPVQTFNVHSFPSSHGSGGPETHAPPAHVSPTVQLSPSLHDAEFGGLLHTPAVQTSSVQGFPSLQSPPSMHPAASHVTVKLPVPVAPLNPPTRTL
jgi:hypothetical protein